MHLRIAIGGLGVVEIESNDSWVGVGVEVEMRCDYTSREGFGR